LPYEEPPCHAARIITWSCVDFVHAMMPSKWKYLATKAGKESWLTRYRHVFLCRYCNSLLKKLVCEVTCLHEIPQWDVNGW